MERERLDEVAAVQLLRLQAQIEDQPIRAVAERLLSRPAVDCTCRLRD
jgi:AmiR/NasT family two-component response regulator